MQLDWRAAPAFNRDLTTDLLADGAEFDERGPMSADELSRTRLPDRRYRPTVRQALRGAGQDMSPHPEETA